MGPLSASERDLKASLHCNPVLPWPAHNALGPCPPPRLAYALFSPEYGVHDVHCALRHLVHRLGDKHIAPGRSRAGGGSGYVGGGGLRASAKCFGCWARNDAAPKVASNIGCYILGRCCNPSPAALLHAARSQVGGGAAGGVGRRRRGLGAAAVAPQHAARAAKAALCRAPPPHTQRGLAEHGTNRVIEHLRGKIGFHCRGKGRDYQSGSLQKLSLALGRLSAAPATTILGKQLSELHLFATL